MLRIEESSTAVADREASHVAGMVALQERAMAVIASGSLHDVLKVHSQAEATKKYAAKHKRYQEASAQFSEIAARAARRGGELLAEMDLKSKRSENLKQSPKFHDETSVSLTDLGITKQQSSRWQTLAAIPDQTFEHHIQQSIQRSEPVTMKSLLKLAPKKNEAAALSDEPLTEARVVKSFEEIAGEKFSVIYADPPWSYGNQATRSSTDRHYVTMSVADICAMPVKEHAAENAQLHLWTTSGFLREAFDVMEAWGFSYRSGFVWCKSLDECDAWNVDMTQPAKAKIGIGNYWRLSHEYLLTGIRGSATFVDKSLPSWAAMRTGRHSRKPDAVRFMVERSFRGKRLELFGREASAGWTVFGNEVHVRKIPFDDRVGN